MSTLERAVAIAAEAHAGQIDKAGKAYLLHPLRLMLQMETLDEQVVAVLHDVVEDSDWSLEDLREEGFSSTVVAGVDAVTRRDTESYEEFVLRAARHRVGGPVKLADLRDNCDLGRIASPTAKDHERVAKYERAIAMIERRCSRHTG